MTIAVSRTGEERLHRLLGRNFGMLIGGELVPALDARILSTMSPANGRHLADVPFAGRADVDRAVTAALAAFPAWRRTSLLERITCVRGVAEILRANADDLATLDAADGGNPVGEMLKDVSTAALQLEHQAGVAMEVKGETLPSMTASWLLTRREPYGVVGRIGAFNHPLMFTAGKLGPPVLMGNTLIIKVPDQAPLSSLYFAELIKDVFPPGVVNIISGDGATSGDALVRHPDVKRLGLIGSVATGQRIQRSAAETGIKHVTLELGGKNPMIVFPDADLERAVEAAALGTNMHQSAGQSCGSITRLFLHASIHDEFLEKLKARLGTLRIGDPLDPDTQMGPLVSQQQFEKVLAHIESAKAEGAKLVLGGGKREGRDYANGFFVVPTIFDGVTMEMRIANEEVFGPVLSVLTWTDREEVLRDANAVMYGLTASVWTQNLQTACHFADGIDVGYVWINGAGPHFLGAPYGGHKNSGVETEEGIEELYSYTQSKTVSITL